MNRRGLIGAGLAVAVLATSWLALELRPRTEETLFVGPPRPDYMMADYTLVVLDAEGAESFTVTGPVMSRDAHSGEIALNHPYFTMPSEQGIWTATAINGWVNAAADELRLTRSVELDGPPRPGSVPATVRTEALHVRPEERTAHGPGLVTITQGNSILSGVGVDAEFDTRRLQLLTESRMRHDPNTHR